MGKVSWHADRVHGFFTKATGFWHRTLATLATPVTMILGKKCEQAPACFHGWAQFCAMHRQGHNSARKFFTLYKISAL
ncbi:MAG: hypothetical protein PHE74_13340 [Comamonas sp.]|jgi:hypothetical protein|nr:hypothetical protein [Comamonas sp.]